MYIYINFLSFRRDKKDAECILGKGMKPSSPKKEKNKKKKKRKVDLQSSEYLGSLDFPFFVINPRSTLIWCAMICYSIIYDADTYVANY